MYFIAKRLEFLSYTRENLSTHGPPKIVLFRLEWLIEVKHFKHFSVECEALMNL